MRQIWPNKVQNTPKRVCNRGINEKTPIATKTKITKPKNVDKPPVATKSKTTKPKNVDKPPIATKPKIVIKKNPNYDELKNRVIKQLKNTLKSCLMLKKVSI